MVPHVSSGQAAGGGGLTGDEKLRQRHRDSTWLMIDPWRTTMSGGGSSHMTDKAIF